MNRACTSLLRLDWSQKMVLAGKAVVGPQFRGHKIPPTWSHTLRVLRLGLPAENRSGSKIAARDGSALPREGLQPKGYVSFVKMFGEIDQIYLGISGIRIENIREEFAGASNGSDYQSMNVEAIHHKKLR